jgi:hypothetical protein
MEQSVPYPKQMEWTYLRSLQLTVEKTQSSGDFPCRISHHQSSAELPKTRSMSQFVEPLLPIPL